MYKNNSSNYDNNRCKICGKALYNNNDISNPLIEWICPICGAGLSPYTIICSCQTKLTIETPTPTT